MNFLIYKNMRLLLTANVTRTNNIPKVSKMNADFMNVQRVLDDKVVLAKEQ